MLLLLYFTLQPLSAEIAEMYELVQFIFLACGSTCIFVLVAKEFDFLSTKNGRTMTIIMLGFLLYTLAETTWFLFVMAGEDPYPSIADVFWIAGYIPFIVGLGLSAKSIKMKFQKSTLVIWIVLSIVLAISVIAIDVYPLIVEEFNIETLVAVTYPIADVLVIIPALVLVLKYRSGEIARPWAILIIGFFLTAIGDIWYVFEENAGIYTSPYSYVDFFLSLGYVFFIMSGLLFLKLYRK